MKPTRRKLLLAGVTGFGALLSGCETTTEETDTASDTTTQPDDNDEDPDDDPIFTDQPGDDDVFNGDGPIGVGNTSLSGKTNAIIQELNWFYTEYSDAMGEYRLNGQRVTGKLRAMRDDAPDISEDRLDSLEEAAQEFVEYANTQLGEHFAVYFRPRRQRRYVRDIEKFVNRNDASGTRSEIGAMDRWYSQVLTSDFIENQYSIDPIENNRYDDEYEPPEETPTGDGGGFGQPEEEEEEEVETPEFLYDFLSWPGEAEGFSGSGGGSAFYMAYSIDNDEILRIQADDADPQIPNDPNQQERQEIPGGSKDIQVYEQVFEPLSVADARERHFYITINALNVSLRNEDDDNRDQDQDRWASQPVYIQEYSDTDSAQSAFETISNERVSTESPHEIVFRDWTPAFYQNESDIIYPTDGPSTRLRYEAGANVYLDMIQTGKFILAITPDEKPWERREEEWDNLLAETWLAGTEREERGPGGDGGGGFF